MPSRYVRPEGLAPRFFHRATDRHFILLIVLLGIFAAFLRWKDLSSQSLWLDEGFTPWITRFSPRQILEILKVDESAPLYYFLFHYWTVSFGVSEFGMRSLSALFATLSIPAFYRVARKILVDEAAQALAMAIFAVTALQVWYAKEARCYSLLVFISLASLDCLLLYLEKRDALRFASLVFFLAAGLYTHNLVLFYLPGIVAFWLIYPGERKLPDRLKDGLKIGFAVSLLYLPWLPNLLTQLHRQRSFGNFSLPRPSLRNLLGSVSVLLGFDPQSLQELFRAWFRGTHLFGFWTWAPLILALLAVCVFGGIFGTCTADRRKTLAILSYALTPVLLVFVYSRITNPIFVTRLFLASFSILPLTMAAPIAFQSGRRKRLFACVGAVALTGVIISEFGYLGRERKEDWRGVGKHLAGLPDLRRLVVVVPDTAQPLLVYYLNIPPDRRERAEVTGLLAKYQPPDAGLETRTIKRSDDPNTDVLALLSSEMALGKYQEVDAVVQPASSPTLLEPMMEYLVTNCSSLENVEFHWIRLTRCIAPKSTLSPHATLRVGSPPS